MVGVAVGLGLLALSVYRMVTGQGGGSTFVIAILVLLNARLNLRQVRYTRVLHELTQGGALLDAKTGDNG